MGMYDTLYINTDMLPVSEEEKKRIGSNPGWQTKDLYCEMTEAYITDDGYLKINEFEYEVVPKEERPHPEADGLLGACGALRRINQRLVTLNVNFTVNFYSPIGDDDYEFSATFEYGKLKQIVGGKVDTDWKGAIQSQITQ